MILLLVLRYKNNDMIECSVFVPSHITGFFEIVDHSNPLKMGSRGAGVVLDQGVKTRVKIKTGKKEDLKTKINGKKDPKNTTITEKTVDLINKKFKLGNIKIRIYHTISVPIGVGFGISAACALGTSLAIAKLLDLPITYNQAASMAHLAEIELKSGLGDVIAEVHGGLVLRLKEGAPGTGIVDRIISPDLDDLFVITKTLGEIETASIIDDPTYKKRINNVGRNLLSELLKNPNPHKFMELSRKFAEDTSLMSDEVLELVKILDDEVGCGSMVMLGNTAFTISKSPDTSLDDALVSKIDSLGCRFV